MRPTIQSLLVVSSLVSPAAHADYVPEAALSRSYIEVGVGLSSRVGAPTSREMPDALSRPRLSLLTSELIVGQSFTSGFAIFGSTTWTRYSQAFFPTDSAALDEHVDGFGAGLGLRFAPPELTFAPLFRFGLHTEWIRAAEDKLGMGATLGVGVRIHDATGGLTCSIRFEARATYVDETMVKSLGVIGALGWDEALR